MTLIDGDIALEFSTPGSVATPYHCGSIMVCGLESDQTSYL